MTFFNSLFGMTYITLMPVFAVDMLKIGSEGQGLLLGVSGVGALITTIWFLLDPALEIEVNLLLAESS